MPRKHAAPKSYHRCPYCGALFLVKYGCTCNETQVFRRIRELFPGVVIEDATEHDRTGKGASGENGAGTTA